MGGGSWYKLVYRLLSAKGGAYFCTSIAIEMGGVSRYFSKVSGSGVDVTLLISEGMDCPQPLVLQCFLSPTPLIKKVNLPLFYGHRALWNKNNGAIGVDLQPDLQVFCSRFKHKQNSTQHPPHQPPHTHNPHAQAHVHACMRARAHTHTHPREHMHALSPRHTGTHPHAHVHATQAITMCWVWGSVTAR